MTIDRKSDGWGDKSVTWSPLSTLSRRIGQRYGFASVGLSSNTEVALLGGAVHFEATGGGSTDIEKGNPVPFSQIYCIGPIVAGDEPNNSPFECELMSIKPAADLPCPRLYHSASVMHLSNSSSSAIIVFGGQAFSDKRKLSDIWSLVVVSEPSSEEEHGHRHSGVWRELAPASRSSSFPPPRSQHAIAVVPGSDMLIVSGGSGFEQTVLGDMWVANIGGNGTNVIWKRINSPMGKIPTARRSHSLSPLVSDIELLLHGGIDSNGNVLSDLWIAQFTNEEKTRCIWTELVSSPIPRFGHIIGLSAGNRGENNLIVFGGSSCMAEKYDLKTGVWWSSAPRCIETLAAQYRAIEVDVVYKSGGSDFPVQSILMIGDTVDRQSPIAPYVASIFSPISSSDGKDNDGEMEIVKQEEDEKMEVERKDYVALLDADLENRKNSYRRIASYLPCIPPGEIGGGHGVVAVVSTPPHEVETSLVPQFILHSVEYLFNNLFTESKDSLRSVSSWSGGSQTSCHVMGTCTNASPSFTNLIEFEKFVNDPQTFKSVTETSNSGVIVLNGVDDDEKFVAFISESLERHSSSLGKFPVISTRTTPYSEIQATLRSMMIYTPFRSSEALTELFGLLSMGSGGFLLIDFDGESPEHKAPLASHFKPTVAKDATLFWYEALRTLTRPRPRIEQYALRYLNECNFAVNGQIPSTSLWSTLKTKILTNSGEKNIANIGSVLIGSMKNGPNLGVLLYSDGVLVRHLCGRFAQSGDHDLDLSDPLQAALRQVTAVVDVKSLSVVAGGMSDFTEAVGGSPDWSKFTSKIEELCLMYVQKKSI